MFTVDDAIEIRGVNARPFGGKTLLISDVHGYWALVKSRELIGRLSSPITYGKLIAEKPAWEGDIERLWKSGVLLKNGQRRFVPRNPFVGKPLHLVLKLTLACNLRCSYCYVSAGTGKGMDIETGKRTIGEFLKISRHRCRVLFHGGEPLLAFDVLKELFQWGREEAKRQRKDLSFSVLSNGTIMSDEMIAFFKRNDVSLAFSLDCSQEAQDRNRIYPDGSGSYEKVRATLDRVSGAGLAFNLVTVVNRHNWKTLDDLVPLMKRYGVRTVTCNPLFFGGRAMEARDLGIRGAEYFEGMRKLLDALIAYNRSGQDKLYELNMSFLARNLTNLDYTYMCLASPCGAGMATLSVSPNGDVYPCDEFTNVKGFLCGNINEEPLERILQKPAMQQVSLVTVENLVRCHDCDWKRFCGGGCRSKNFHFSGALDGPNPLCDYYKKMIPYMIQLLSEGKVPLDCLRGCHEAVRSRASG